MMVQDAYKKVKQLPGKNVLIECLDFGNVWGFAFAETSADEDFGGAYDLVDKNTGELSMFNPPDDFERYNSAKIIPIEQFND